ncbi:histidine--tRNA ligase [Anaerococcus hydrogenalis]|uniref:Histidine--tRNA ligase n=1 Tax=Anaerococcus hydrogenalis TaxID=33029 RepID=A0A2N6UK21_9FIRM|nr:histidine--tRNA ligase [Anaerococcus hydrogenalis]MDK7694145.1 histidine--tRNA ligase [Anaerococcus hydrogenalis]MDK7695923.1 histidine--tRNA ligase [Anaerococcus hydrogenalis]MDK7707172.1 histidine--tRNA ligase [Anaerococcus hydrogenalis]PMC82200.1 histidine--tRNA ligase [Anaerococcus hydrogenalis]
MNIVKPQTIAGVMELLPDDQLVFDHIKQIIEETFLSYQFLPIDTPAIEKNDILFAKGGGETEKQIFGIDSSKKDMSLRFDLTVPLARYVSEHFSDLNFPFKRYQIGKVYRGERNQKGRYKEFYQCDIDIIGNDSLSIHNDALLPKVIYDIFQKLDFKGIKFHINNRKLLNGFFESIEISDKEEVLRTIDKKAKIGDEKTKELLTELCGEDKALKLMGLINNKRDNKELLKYLESLDLNDNYKLGLRELKEVYDYMIKFGIDDESIMIDLSITRGLDYYTSTVYETFLDGYESIGSVCSGGRYENLAGNFSKQNLPGVGLSIGLTRLFYQLQELGLLEKYREDFTDCLIIPMDEKLNFYAIDIKNDLKNKGYKVDIYLEDGKFKKKINYADKIGVKKVIIIGQEEYENKMVSVKNMEDGNQVSVKIEDIGDYL